VTPRAHACAAAALLLAACSGAGARAPEPSGAPAQAPAPTALSPEFGAEVGARFQPGLEALARAVSAGEDELARALISHVDSLGPDERVWELTRAFERILDGRAAVRCLELELACVEEPAGTVIPGVQAGAQAWRLFFRAHNTGADAIELFPGPATLHSTRTDLGRHGGGSSTQETRAFDKLRRFALEPDARAEVELARFFLAPPPGLLAVRMDFELELRSGSLKRGGRELPAMRLAVRPARAARHAADLPPGALTPAELLAASAGLTDADELLALAVRTDPGPAGSGLVELEEALSGLVATRLELWIPSLRWLAGSDVPKDVPEVRDWLRGRRQADAAAAPRPALVLPRERAEPPGGN
jgi:hypothetical protein